MSITKELQERRVIELLEQGLSDAEINRRTKQQFRRGVSRERIAKIRASRPRVIQIKRSAEALPAWMHFISADFFKRAEERAQKEADAEALAAEQADPEHPHFVSLIRNLVEIIARCGEEAPRIGKIRGQASEHSRALAIQEIGHPDEFERVIGGAVERLIHDLRYLRGLSAAIDKTNDFKLLIEIIERAADTRETPAALAEIKANFAPLVKVIDRAVHAERMEILRKSAAASATQVDLSDQDKMDPFVLQPTPSVESELLTEERAGFIEIAPWDEGKKTPGPNRTPGMSGDIQPSHEGHLVESTGDNNVSGGHHTSAAYVGGEDAQFDARDKLDRYDSANYHGAPKRTRVIAEPELVPTSLKRFPGDRAKVRAAGDNSLARGGLPVTWRERISGPGYVEGEAILPAGARVRHAAFGEGIVLHDKRAYDASNIVTADFGARDFRWVPVDSLELIGAPSEEPAERERVSRLWFEAKLLAYAMRSWGATLIPSPPAKEPTRRRRRRTRRRDSEKTAILRAEMEVRIARSLSKQTERQAPETVMALRDVGRRAQARERLMRLGLGEEFLRALERAGASLDGLGEWVFSIARPPEEEST